MSSKAVTLIVLLVLSQAIGIALGEWFFRLYINIVPPVVLGDFNKQASRLAHLSYGSGVGLVLFVWALVGMFSARMMKSSSKSPTKI